MTMTRRERLSANRPIGFVLLLVAGSFQELAVAITLHMPSYLMQRGFGEARIGTLFGIASVLSLGLRPALGRLLDTVDERIVWRSLLLVLMVCLWMFRLTDTVSVVLLGVVITQICGIGLYTTAWSHVAVVLDPDRRSRGFALFGVAATLPILVGGAGGDLVIQQQGYNALFAIAIGLAGMALLATFALSEAAGSSGVQRRGVLSLLRAGNMRPLWALVVAASLGMLTIFTFGKTFSSESAVADPFLTFGVVGVVALVTRVVSYRLAERFSVARMTVAAIVFYAVGLATFVRADSLAWLVVGLAMAGAGHGVVMPLLSVLVVGAARSSEVGSALASMTAFIDMTWLLGAPIVGVLISRWNYSMAFSLVAVVMILLTGLAGLMRRSSASRAAVQ